MLCCGGVAEVVGSACPAIARIMTVQLPPGVRAADDAREVEISWAHDPTNDLSHVLHASRRHHHAGQLIRARLLRTHSCHSSSNTLQTGLSPHSSPSPLSPARFKFAIT
jgi:hypothetical protein